nr:PH-interacting protein-like [Lytechinus pictus]
MVVPALSYAVARFREEFRRKLDEEASGRFKAERKKKVMPSPVETTDSGDSYERLRRRKKPKKTANHNYRTRANQDGTPLQEGIGMEEERRRRMRVEEIGADEGDDTLTDVDEPADEGAMTGAETSEEEVEWRSTSEHESESSEYSDWTADAGINLQPPKRKSRRREMPWESGGESSSSPMKTPSATPVKSKRKRRE